MKIIIQSVICICLLGMVINPARAQRSISQKVDALLKKALAEKIGQLQSV